MTNNTKRPEKDRAETPVKALPTEHVAIIQSDSTVINPMLMGIICSVSGDVYVKFKDDTTFFKHVVTPGDIILGEIKGVGASTTLADADMVGLK